MNRTTCPFVPIVLSTAAVVLAVLAPGAQGDSAQKVAEPTPQKNPVDLDDIAIRCDPRKVEGAQSCAKCHENEVAVWKLTPHYATFDNLHRKPEAKEIAGKLGLRSIKRNDICTKCHYTCQQKETRKRVIAGVSCESCHGAAQDWLTMHNDYGGPDVTKEMESPAHRKTRLEQSIARGMNNPVNLYLVARQCLACHTTPNEELVNLGGHTPGSKDFELVAWSQGMVRHNFLRTGGASNAAGSPQHLRVMYVVGILADLEASMRATALATEKATFGVTSAKRAAALKKRLYEIGQLVDNQYVKQALDVALAVKLKLNNRPALLAAAGAIGKAARDLAENEKDASLSGIDHLLPSPDSYKRSD